MTNSVASTSNPPQPSTKLAERMRAALTTRLGRLPTEAEFIAYQAFLVTLTSTIASIAKREYGEGPPPTTQL